MAPGPQVPFEVIVNVDHPRDADVWLDWAYNKTQGLVVPVFSYNGHESRWAQAGPGCMPNMLGCATHCTPPTPSVAPTPDQGGLDSPAHRSYNRAAGIARASVITVAQDDQIIEVDKNCTWMRNLVSLFHKHPRLGAIGHRGWCGHAAACQLVWRSLIILLLCDSSANT